jgi:hypothetical protein
VAGQHPVIHAFFTNLIQQEVLPDTLCTEEEVKKWGVDLGLSDEVATLVAKLARDDDYTFEHFHADYATQVLGTSGVWVDESVIMFVQHVLRDIDITLIIHDTKEYRTTTGNSAARVEPSRVHARKATVHVRFIDPAPPKTYVSMNGTGFTRVESAAERHACA